NRDIMYVNTDKEKYKPISVIITTLVALTLEKKPPKSYTILDIMNLFINESDSYIKKNFKEWIIHNPVDNQENLADRWSEDNQVRVIEFLNWRDSLKELISK